MPIVSNGDAQLSLFISKETSSAHDSQVIQPRLNNKNFQRLSPVPLKQTSAPAEDSVVSDIQRERQEILAIYESSHVLPVPPVCQTGGQIAQSD